MRRFSRGMYDQETYLHHKKVTESFQWFDKIQRMGRNFLHYTINFQRWKNLTTDKQRAYEAWILLRGPQIRIKYVSNTHFRYPV